MGNLDALNLLELLDRLINRGGGMHEEVLRLVVVVASEECDREDVGKWIEVVALSQVFE